MKTSLTDQQIEQCREDGFTNLGTQDHFSVCSLATFGFRVDITSNAGPLDAWMHQ